MKTHKVCFFNRSSIHYRKNIWLLMDKELPCDFYFGDSRPGKIEPIPYTLFENFKGEFHNVSFGYFYWQKGALSLLKTDLKVMRNCLFKVSFAKIWRIGLHLHLDSF